MAPLYDSPRRLKNEYTDKHDKKTFDLTGKTTTFTDVKKYFGGTSGTLAVGFPDLGV